ncbi:hypothetical protein ACO2J1_00480 [Leptospira interrogans]|uniref:Uncharacterized protein n=1 Tax=Leptospira interrogans serovar Pomona TaxID=44276 RepID=A0AA40WDY1_LEPIR|nr:hypothetical protein [Leptospira interrogans]MCD1184114.1 hypothetical protein [Leptospira sp. Pond_2020]AJR12958.1 hypothetical protein LIL_10356 [Leptospira interrogans serovar Linhai str. 56609]ASV06691.1 hypothetical protein B2G47_13115 [Leptospira interrogans serovar Canicola]ASV08702.1 hypothetical protein B2G50_06580 [Leptospira interrogans serovar Canicola]EKR45617.1 hypothetical protein LEP1GSC097_4490 [Leptospira interrogans serovar Grippotyphosa str. UI 08368]
MIKLTVLNFLEISKNSGVLTFQSFIVKYKFMVVPTNSVALRIFKYLFFVITALTFSKFICNYPHF